MNQTTPVHRHSAADHHTRVSITWLVRFVFNTVHADIRSSVPHSVLPRPASTPIDQHNQPTDSTQHACGTRHTAHSTQHTETTRNDRLVHLLLYRMMTQRLNRHLACQTNQRTNKPTNPKPARQKEEILTHSQPVSSQRAAARPLTAPPHSHSQSQSRPHSQPHSTHNSQLTARWLSISFLFSLFSSLFSVRPAHMRRELTTVGWLVGWLLVGWWVVSFRLRQPAK